MLPLAPFTALFLTFQPAGFPSPWQPHFGTPHHIEMQPTVGIPPLGGPMRSITPNRLKEELQPNPDPTPHASSKPHSPSPLPTTSPAKISAHSIATAPPSLPPPPATDSWEPPTRPSSSFSRHSTEVSGFSGFATASAVSAPPLPNLPTTADLPATLTWNIFHPWLGLIYIHSPGFISQPGTITAYPFIRPGLPHPVSPADPSIHLSEGELLAWPYQPGYVTWITHF